MAEEERVVLVVSQSLEQLASRLHARPSAHPSQDENSDGVVAVSEGAQFVGLLDGVVHTKHQAGPHKTRELALNLQPSLIPTLVSLLQSESLLRTIEELNSSALINQICNFLLHCGKVRTDVAGKEGTAVVVAQDLCQAITQAGGVDALLRVALTAPQEEVYAAAAQALYSILHVSPHARQRMADDALFRVLVRSLGDDSVPRRRHILALCLREVVNDQPFTVSSSNEATLVLVRAFSLDDNPDVQIAAAESLEMLLRAATDQWRSFSRKRELAMGIIGILEKGGARVADQHAAVAVSALRLLETCIRCEGCVPATEAQFLVPFLKSFGDRHLARLHTLEMGKVGALAARCLRLVVENAPPASGLGIALMNDHNALSSIVNGLLSASNAPLPSDENDAGQHSAAIVAKLLCVEASYCIALILAQDPQSRDAFAQQLSRDPSSMAQVRGALVKGLNAAALEYYNETAIVDVTGVVVNDPSNVQWEVASAPADTSAASSSKRPTQSSIRAAFDDQEDRLADLIRIAESGEEGASEIPLQIVGTAVQNLKKFRRELGPQVEQTARLTFIMLSYATFITLRRDDDDPENGGFLSHASSPSRRRGGHQSGQINNGAGVVQGILNSNIRASAFDGGNASSSAMMTHASAEHPAPTRASLLRTWANNPRQREALERAASAAAAGDHSLVSSNNAKSSTYVEVMMQRDDSRVVGTPPRLSGASPVRGGGGAAGGRQHFQQQQQHSSAISLGISQSPMKQYAFSKFDSALALATSFAQFFSNTSSASLNSPSRASGGAAAVFETDGAFARRKAPPKKSHYAAPTPNAKTWGIPQLKEGDLFYFSIPLSSISVDALEQVQNRAVRHLKNIKDQFAVTPHAARARRWFLFDMLNNIMPGIISCFSELVALCDAHGEESVKFPLLLFAESVVGTSASSRAPTATSPGAAMERGTLHSGNLIESTAQARFYFQSVTQQQQQQQARTQASPMGAALSAGEEASSAYLKDLERKIASLAEQRFSGHERMYPSISDDDDDDEEVHRRIPQNGFGADEGNAVVTPGTTTTRLGGGARRAPTNNLLGRKDVVNRSRPNKRRGMTRGGGGGVGLDRIDDDDDSD